MARSAETRKRIKTTVGFGIVVLVITAIFLFPGDVRAATLYLVPASKNIHTGQAFTVAVDVSSVDQAMNAVSGDITFPSNRLQVLSISKSNSIISLWVRDPSFTNSTGGGDVHFEGIVLNPGYTGSAGSVITITFQAVAPGSAAVAFSDGSVLANDGNGTNILTAMQSAAFTITPMVGQAVPDTIPPAAFTIAEFPGSVADPTDPRPLFTWSTTDSGSGIAKYLVKIGGGDWFDASTIRVATSTDLYQLPLQAPENGTMLSVEAFDRAGNITTATTTFSVDPIAAPMVLNYTKTIVNSGQSFQVEGTAIPGSLVTVYLRKSGSANTLLTYSARADMNGAWQAGGSFYNVPSGLWLMTVQDADSRGALSAPGAGLPVNVENWFGSIIDWLFSWAGVILVAVLLMCLIAALIYVIYLRFSIWRINAQRELMGARKELHDDLVRLDKELSDSNPQNIDAKHEMIQKEIDHIQTDLKSDIEKEIQGL